MVAPRPDLSAAPFPRESADRADQVILVGDLGATYLRFALARGGQLLTEPWQTERAAVRDCGEACRLSLSMFPHRLRIEGAALAAAGPLDGGRIHLTNADWVLDPEALAGELGLRAQRVRLLNDFVALARSLPTLHADGLRPLPGRSTVQPDPQGHRVVVGPGSGLGVAALLHTPQGWWPLATEGGHASAVAETDFERAAVAQAIARHGRASWERLLSGPGLALLHALACEKAGRPPPSSDPAAVLAGCERGDPAALRAARTFIEWMGAFAGDLALLYDARGGVVLAGGILPRLAQALPFDGLRTRFEAKGRFSAWAASLPLDLLVEPRAALLGAARAYLDAPGSH